MAFMMKFRWPSAQVNDKASKVLEESLQIFEAALDRLDLLRGARAPLLTLNLPGKGQPLDMRVPFGNREAPTEHP